MTLSGGQTAVDPMQPQSVTKEPTPTVETLVVLPNDSKKQRKGGKGLYGNKGKTPLIVRAIFGSTPRSVR